MRKPHIFTWDEEPSEGRPSEFLPSSLYGQGRVPTHPPRRRSGGVRLSSVFVALVVCVGLGGVAMQGFVHLLRG